MLTPLRDVVVLKAEKPADRTPSGLYLPNADKKTIARVLAIGPGYWESGVFVKTTAKVGDHVELDPNAWGTETVLDGEKVLIVRERELLGVHSGARRVKKVA